MDGFEVCRRLQTDPATADIPVIFITAHDQTDALVEGFRVGGVDFIGKPFSAEEVRQIVSDSWKELQREIPEPT